MIDFRKGSHTVEAAVIMGVTFLIFSAIFYMGSYVYGRVYMVASAYEQAFAGRLKEESGLWGFGDIERTCSFEESENKVSYHSICYSVWGGFQKELHVEAAVEKEKPVTFIRKWQIAEEIGR